MRILLIDNYDSFTYNLFHLLAAAAGEPPVVVRNDAIPAAAVDGGEFDGIVISPGPGDPDDARDFGGCLEVIRGTQLPVLGVCLGHQGIARAFGGTVGRTEPVHGQATEVRHDGSPLFAGLPERFDAMRYHSLAVTGLAPELSATAWDNSGQLMALAHHCRPIFGVQFHPESAGTPLGPELLANFVAIVRERGPRRPPSSPRAAAVPPPRRASSPTHRVDVRPVGRLPDPAAAFKGLFGDDDFAFWIDREHAGPAASCSAMGSASAPGSEVLTYRVGTGSVRVDSPADGSSEEIEGSIFDVLRGRLAERRMDGDPRFDFCGGYVGYLGYELKADLGSPGRHASAVPDACLIYAPRLLVLDHRSGEAYAVQVLGPADDQDEAAAWAEWLRREIAALADAPAVGGEVASRSSPPTSGLDRNEYLEAIAAAKRSLYAGDSYELCLTDRTTVEFPTPPDPTALYLSLRATSPAPQAGYLRFGDAALLGASPELFLAVGRDGRVRTSPIKGTRPRGEGADADRALVGELGDSDKERAENMMIVDVLRNDLGRVCEVGSVTVGKLLEVETFAHVHQLVSTVEGQLAGDRDAVDCAAACFPGGSMTGAPKLRSMEILDALESGARGPYAGAFGWFGLAGDAELSIVIRSIVLSGARASVGAGGAITVLSDPEAEYEEMRLKARPLLELLGVTSAAGSR
ncbi:MAG TPA: chorismate-binding protein [Solirubrobacterales bacterium]|jgi:para-aminobenzoate synthetase